MFKVINTLLLITLLTACSAEDSKKSNEANSTKVKETEAKVEAKKVETKNVEIKKDVAQKSVAKQEQKQEKKQENNSSKEKASLFTLTTLEGKTIHIDEIEGGLSFKEYKDKAVFLLFFGHRCPPCLGEIPVLTALTKEGHKDLEIVAIEVQGLSKDQLKVFKKRKDINYNLVTYDNAANLVNYIAKQAQWSGAIPFLIGLDKKGVVKVVHAGGLRAQDFNNVYNTLAKGE